VPLPRSGSLVLALAACALACQTAPGPLRGRSVPASGEYVQRESGARFPEHVGELSRAEVIAWDDAESNVGVSYREGERALFTLYVYPAGDARAGRLRSEFLGASESLQQVHPAALRENAAIVRLPRPDGPAVGFEARFKLLDATDGERTLVQVFQCGRWFLKLRATHVEGYPVDAALDGLHEQVPCEALAAREPLGTKPGIDLDPALPSRELSPTAEWVAYGYAELGWISRNVAPEDLVFGIPDHDPALYVAAWNATLDARRKLQGEGKAAADPFLDHMLEIQDAGWLDEYVWSEYLGFLAPPDAARFEAYSRWRDATLPAHRHELHATAHLHD